MKGGIVILPCGISCQSQLNKFKDILEQYYVITYDDYLLRNPLYASTSEKGCENALIVETFPQMYNSDSISNTFIYLHLIDKEVREQIMKQKEQNKRKDSNNGNEKTNGRRRRSNL